MNDPTSTEVTTSKSPTHLAYHVRDILTQEGAKAFWTRIGSAWAHGDGKGFNITIETVPLDGRITLRTPSEVKE